MSKNIFDKTLSIFRSKGSFDKNKGVSEHKRILKDEFEMFETALELGKLYKEFFDELNIKLRNTFDIEYIYPHEFIIGSGIKSENKKIVELFKQIKELEK